jgi:hypothetical protein
MDVYRGSGHAEIGCTTREPGTGGGAILGPV